jgi:hypothetical protein
MGMEGQINRLWLCCRECLDSKCISRPKVAFNDKFRILIKVSWEFKATSFVIDLYQWIKEGRILADD